MARPTHIRDAHFPGRVPIDTYGDGGFRFADMSHRGSLLLLPSGVYGWDMAEGDALTVDAFQRVLDEAGEIEFLLVGTGRDIRPARRAEGGHAQPRNIVGSDGNRALPFARTTSCWANRGRWLLR